MMSRTDLLSTVSPLLLFFPKQIKFPPHTLFVRKVPEEQLVGCAYVAQQGFYIVCNENAVSHGFFDGHQSAFDQCKDRGYTLLWAN
jgi:hypothetical protein